MKILAKGVAVYPTYAERLNKFIISRIYPLIVVGSSSILFVFIDALSASSSISNIAFDVIFPFIVCVLNQLRRFFKTVEFFLTTRIIG